jgi:hypothetical protein
MFTILPQRWARIFGSASCVSCTSPNTFVSNCRRTASIGTVSIAPLWL